MAASTPVNGCDSRNARVDALHGKTRLVSPTRASLRRAAFRFALPLSLEVHPLKLLATMLATIQRGHQQGRRRPAHLHWAGSENFSQTRSWRWIRFLRPVELTSAAVCEEGEEHSSCSAAVREGGKGHQQPQRPGRRRSSSQARYPRRLRAKGPFPEMKYVNNRFRKVEAATNDSEPARGIIIKIKSPKG